MSTFKLFTLGLALLLGLAAQMVTAAPMAQADADAIFAALDADRNGQVTAEELARMPEARFAAQDTNGDGMLDAQELIASLQARMADRVDRMIGDLDLDGDGLLSQSEMMGGRDQHEGCGEPNFDRMLSRMDAMGMAASALRNSRPCPKCAAAMSAAKVAAKGVAIAAKVQPDAAAPLPWQSHA